LIGYPFQGKLVKTIGIRTLKKFRGTPTLIDYLHGNTLWLQVEAVSKSALNTGALKSIPTRREVRNITIGDYRVDFQIRVVENLMRKSKEVQDRAKQLPNPKSSDQKSFNPFLPYEPDLYVGELTDHYRCLLNKFNVMDHHILMVTTQHEPQQTPLGVEDFLAAQICLQAQDGLVFYNGGPEAGASVEHKHLQMIPLPLEPIPLSPIPLGPLLVKNDAPFPFHKIFSTVSTSSPTTSALPFKHLVIATDFSVSGSFNNLKTSAENNCHNYQQILKELDLSTNADGMIAPHNLLMTRDSLWVVPRRKERFQGLAVNALGFSGTLLVKDTQQLNELDDIGCLNLLKAVAFSS
jgi:ATP adenylyltransferase